MARGAAPEGGYQVTDAEARAELRAQGICEHCHQHPCNALAPNDYAAHERMWRSGASRRPWWSARELLQILSGVPAGRVRHDYT